MVHLTPTSSSWLNLVERGFRELTTKRLQRGLFLSAGDLLTAIDRYLRIHNEVPQPSCGLHQ